MHTSIRFDECLLFVGSNIEHSAQYVNLCDVMKCWLAFARWRYGKRKVNLLSPTPGVLLLGHVIEIPDGHNHISNLCNYDV
jgi:hypothetical protein